MADPKKRLATNVDGEFYVDSSCIDCDACRQIAPSVFVEDGNYSSVFQQPSSAQQRRDAWRALIACPVGSIGTTGENLAREVQDDFPLLLEEDVFYCGYNSRESYGANSYFIRHPEGNWLIESPRYSRALVRRLAEAGGVKYIFLSHRDDVADADKYAAEFGSKRIIHEAELAYLPGAEIVIKGNSTQIPVGDFQIIPTPGHTEGHCVLLYKDKFLFSGDHLYFNRASGRLDVFERYCWYSLEEQKQSVRLLLNFRFQWLLPGHGQRVKFSENEMQKRIAELCRTFD